jgi:hypothetical protein
MKIYCVLNTKNQIIVYSRNYIAGATLIDIDNINKIHCNVSQVINDTFIENADLLPSETDMENKRKIFEKKEKIYALKKKLADTDYVSNKLIEAYALNKDLSSLVSEYSDILTQRQEWRDEINKLEEN